jgi:hypothetical protein
VPYKIAYLLCLKENYLLKENFRRKSTIFSLWSLREEEGELKILYIRTLGVLVPHTELEIEFPLGALLTILSATPFHRSCFTSFT